MKGMDNKMSEDNETVTDTDTTTNETVTGKKRVTVDSSTVKSLVEGIPQYDKASFTVVGHKGGVRLALPRTNGISRAYFYGNGDYSLVPEHPAISVFSAEKRKEHRLGGIMAEVNFDLGVDEATSALKALLDVVRAAPAPAPKALKSPKKEKAAPTAPVSDDVPSEE